MSKIASRKNTRTNINITNSCIKSQQKKINNQEILSLRKLLKPEVREVKGKEYTDAYVRILEKQYEKIIEDSFLNNEI